MVMPPTSGIELARRGRLVDLGHRPGGELAGFGERLLGRLAGLGHNRLEGFDLGAELLGPVAQNRLAVAEPRLSLRSAFAGLAEAVCLEQQEDRGNDEKGDSEGERNGGEGDQGDPEVQEKKEENDGNQSRRDPAHR